LIDKAFISTALIIGWVKGCP